MSLIWAKAWDRGFLKLPRGFKYAIELERHWLGQRPEVASRVLSGAAPQLPTPAGGSLALRPAEACWALALHGVVAGHLPARLLPF